MIEITLRSVNRPISPPFTGGFLLPPVFSKGDPENGIGGGSYRHTTDTQDLFFNSCICNISDVSIDQARLNAIAGQLNERPGKNPGVFARHRLHLATELHFESPQFRQVMQC